VESAPATPQNEVAVFLCELGMSQYAGKLISNGFDEMETLLEIEDTDLRDLGITPCHLVKLRRKLQELQRQSSVTSRETLEDNPVAAFMHGVGLEQYAAVLVQNGFDDMETLLEIEDSDMRDLGFSVGHARKLRLRLREHKVGPQAAEERPVEGGLRRSSKQQAHSTPAPQLNRLPRLPSSSGDLPDVASLTAVKQSWKRMQDVGIDEAAKLFYQHLFLISPEAIGLFPPEVRRKYRNWMEDEQDDESNVYESPALRNLFSKMINAIGCTVAGLHDFGKLVPMLTQLGSRHVTYGVTEPHWPLLGKALVNTLRDCLGSSFSTQVETAWSLVFTFMSSIMVEGFRIAKVASTASASPWVAAPLSSPALAGPWVEDCRLQGSHGDISHRVTPGTATTVQAVEVLCPARRLPRLWEDDCHSESQDSCSTGIPSHHEAGQELFARQASPWSEDILRKPKEKEDFVVCQPSLCRSSLVHGSKEGQKRSQPPMAG